MRRVLEFFLLAPILLTIGCSSTEIPTNWSVEEFHAKASGYLESGDWEQAIAYYRQLKTRYPYGKYTKQAELDLIYAHYRNNEPELAISSANEFIRLHPTHPKIDYAYYLKGLASFQPHSSLLNRLSRVDPSSRDLGSARKSFEIFNNLVIRFPKSRYATYAHQHMAELLALLAEHDLNIARYYARRGAYVAAINRSKYIIEQYPELPVVEHALGIMLTTYNKMGLNSLHNDVLRILQLNYPDSNYLPPSSS